MLGSDDDPDEHEPEGINGGDPDMDREEGQSADQILPLRIQNNTLSSSPNKKGAPPTQRPLAELGPTERRRNSPSYNQNTKVRASTPWVDAPTYYHEEEHFRRRFLAL